jgi:hypothetical protein
MFLRSCENALSRIPLSPPFFFSRHKLQDLKKSASVPVYVGFAPSFHYVLKSGGRLKKSRLGRSLGSAGIAPKQEPKTFCHAPRFKSRPATLIADSVLPVLRTAVFVPASRPVVKDKQQPVTAEQGLKNVS